MSKVLRALISVYDKSGVVEFAKALHGRGVEILSTGGTSRLLKESGIPVVEVADYTGSPEILGGRLKTLHPKIHGGLLGIRGDEAHEREMADNGILPVDLLVVNLYPFEATVARPGCTFEEAIENIDIGGPAMIRAAAKNHGGVGVVVCPSDYQLIVEELDANDGALSVETRFALAKKAFVATASYDSSIINYLTAFDDSKGSLPVPTDIGMTFSLVQTLRYGENPHQQAAFYRCPHGTDRPSLVESRQLQGKELSYNNIMDADAVVGMVAEFYKEPFAAVVVKHANPCGAAVSPESLRAALANAIACDPTSAFGGIIGVSRAVDGEAAKVIAETFFEVVVAPAYDADALEILGKKKNLRVLKLKGLGEQGPVSLGWHVRDVRNGLLVQRRDASSEDVRGSRVMTRRAPTAEEFKGLDFAWRICKHVKSNAIVFTSTDRTLGIGAGQMNRIDSTKIAAMKARASLEGSFLASDAFFPFRDGVDAAAEAGARAIVQPGGSMRDDEVIAAADEHGIAMVFTGVRHFRH